MPVPTSIPLECQLTPPVAPTLPAEIPGYTELDPTTNLHMTGTYQQIDLNTYRLKVTGKVDRPFSSSFTNQYHLFDPLGLLAALLGI